MGTVRRTRTIAGAVGAALVVACSASGGSPLGGQNGQGVPGVDAAPAADDASAPASDATFSAAGDGAQPPAACPYMDAFDHDGDGFSSADGDCNDCDPDINPGALDVPGNGIDEDCSGVPDDEPTGCDATVALASSNPFDAARAIDLCRQTTANAVGRARTWGVIDAAFVAPDGTDRCVPFGGPSDAGSSCAANPEFSLGYGNLSKLGVNVPRVGAHMLALSSGTAREPTDPGYVNEIDKQYTDGAAAGFPAPSPACPGLITGQPHDGVALALTIRVPTNARSFSLNENFFTHEYPAFICSNYDDAFVIEMTPPQPQGRPTEILPLTPPETRSA